MDWTSEAVSARRSPFSTYAHSTTTTAPITISSPSSSSSLSSSASFGGRAPLDAPLLLPSHGAATTFFEPSSFESLESLSSTSATSDHDHGLGGALLAASPPSSRSYQQSQQPQQRRVVSAPPNPFAQYSSSPRSPLSQGHWPAHLPSSPTPGTEQRTWTRSPSSTRVRQISANGGSKYPFLSSSGSPTPAGRRRSLTSSSSTGMPIAGSPGGAVEKQTPFGSLVGSYETSLLAGRMSALPSLPVRFRASIGVLGGSASGTGAKGAAGGKVKCPPHLAMDFDAYFYGGAASAAAGGSMGAGAQGAATSVKEKESNGSPYVGTLDLDGHYRSLLLSSSSATTPTKKPPKFPGYRVPRSGQIQLVIKNEESTAVKLFLIPYDLTGLERAGKGGKTFLRQKSYTVDATSPVAGAGTGAGAAAGVGAGATGGKGRLRYAVHLMFCAPPSSASSSSNNNKDDTIKKHSSATAPAAEQAYYLHHSIRVVFASRALDQGEKLRVVAEGPSAEGGFMPYTGPGEGWELARKEAKRRASRVERALAREKAEKELGEVEGRMGEASLEDPPAVGAMDEGGRGRRGQRVPPGAAGSRSGASTPVPVPVRGFDTSTAPRERDIGAGNRSVPMSLSGSLQGVGDGNGDSEIREGHWNGSFEEASQPTASEDEVPYHHPAFARLDFATRASSGQQQHQREQSHGRSGLSISRPGTPLAGERVGR